MGPEASLKARIEKAVQRDRLVDLATRLVAARSPTNDAGPALDVLAETLRAEGLNPERPAAGHPAAPAVAARLDSGKPGRTIQFNGHLDVVHLPFSPPRVDGDLLTGSGACDMKGGTAAAVEAMLALRDLGALEAGAILLTAHDQHEAPWAFGAQLENLIRAGFVGDAVLLPEPLSDKLPIAGRGQACWKAVIRRAGPPVHEVMRPEDQPNVLAAAGLWIQRLMSENEKLNKQVDPVAGKASVFIGQVHGGEIFNQYPQESWLEGTRRWLPGTHRQDVEKEFRGWADALARETGAEVHLEYQLVRDAFHLDQDARVVAAFQSAFRAIDNRTLPLGPKPFVDDGNTFWSLAGIPAITHGPRAGGQHTTNEWISIDDMVRVARLYALTALNFCGGA